MKKIILKILLILVISCPVYSSQFEELDKPPEGAHAGQIFTGGFVSIGYPMGDIISGEEDFVSGNTHTFDNGTTKEMLVTHLAFDYGLSFEYMPIDYIGAKTKLKRAVIVQRTSFGSDYRNWNFNLYENTSLLIGPSFHLTNRKQWDVTLTPLIGYAIAKYNATPVAAELQGGYSGDGERDVNGFVYGVELNLTAYFSGGFYLSLGTEYSAYPITFSPGYSLSQGGNTFMEGKNSGTLQTINIVISAGYAFSN